MTEPSEGAIHLSPLARHKQAGPSRAYFLLLCGLVWYSGGTPWSANNQTMTIAIIY